MTSAELVQSKLDAVVLTLGIADAILKLDPNDALQIGATAIFTLVNEVMAPGTKVDEVSAVLPMQEFIHTGACTYHGMRIDLAGGKIVVTDVRQ